MPVFCTDFNGQPGVVWESLASQMKRGNKKYIIFAGKKPHPMKKRILCTIMTWLATLTALCTDDMTVRPFPFFADLCSNEIYDVHHDREGLLWIATNGAVSRFDGYRLITFRSDITHPHCLPHNNVRFIADSDSHVWITTEGGIALYDKSRGTIRHLGYAPLEGKFIDDIRCANGKEVWIAADRQVFLSNADGSVLKRIDPFATTGMPCKINGIYMDHSGTLWLMAQHGQLLHLQANGTAFEAMPVFPEHCDPLMMYQDRDGHYWIGTWGNGIWQFFPQGNGPQGHYLRYHIYSRDGKEELNFYGMEQDDASGLLWTLCYNSLHALSYTPGRGLADTDISQMPYPRKMFTKVTKDRWGNIWIGAYDDACTIAFNRSAIRFMPLEGIRQRLGWDTNLTCIQAANDSLAWVVQDRYGLLLYNRNSKEVHHLHPYTGEVERLRTARNGQEVWAVARGGRRVCRYAALRGNRVLPAMMEEVEAPHGTRITDVAEAADGGLWMLTSQGVCHGAATATGHSWTKAMGGTGLRALYADSLHGTWCATDSTLMQVVPQGGGYQLCTKAHIRLLSAQESVKGIYGCGRRGLLLVTSFGRMMHYHKNRMQEFAPKGMTLAGNESFCSLATDDRQLILMTDKRLLMYRWEEDTTTVLKARQGHIGVSTFRASALCTDTRHGAYAGGHGGMIHIGATAGTPTDHHTNAYPVVTDVRVDDRSLFFDTTAVPDSTQTLGHVVMGPGASHLEVYLSKTDLSGMTTQAIQYRLCGLDNGWTTWNEQMPLAYYHQIPHGTYHLEVRIQDAQGNWSKAHSVLTVVKQPAWYQTTLALGLYAILVLAALVALYLYLLRRKAKVLRAEATKVRMAYLDADHAFLEKLVGIIDRHLAESTFGLEVLAEEMQMSKSTLHRKIKAYASTTPLDFIRSVRMKRACSMLESGRMNVSEVAYAVGFSSPQYFARCFKEEYGVTPTEHMRNSKDTQKTEHKNTEQ